MSNGRTTTTTQTAGPPVAGEVLQNQTASEASNGIALHPNTAHRGQNRTTQQAEPGSTSNQTDQRSSSQEGAQSEAPKRKRAQNPQNNNRNNKKARKGTQINRNKKQRSRGRSILRRVLKTPTHHTWEMHNQCCQTKASGVQQPVSVTQNAWERSKKKWLFGLSWTGLWVLAQVVSESKGRYA